MSTTTPSHRRPAPIGIPTMREVHAPGWIQRRPRRLVAGVTMLVLLAVSAFLRSRNLTGELWFNEAIAGGFASQSFGGVLHAVRDGGSSPLYYLLLHFWVNAVGTTEAQMRGLSLLCALLTIPVAGWAGWSLAGERAGLYCAVLFALNGLLTEFAEQAQPYALLMLLGLLAVAAFLHAFVYRRRRYLWLLVIALEAALYTQGSAVLLAVGLAIGLLVVLRCAEPGERGPIVRDAALCLAALVILYLPWLPSTIDQIAHATAPWHYAPVLGASIPADLLGGDRVEATLVVVLVMGVAPLALVRSRRRSREAVALWALLAGGLAGIALAGLLEIAAPVWLSRYFATLVPVAVVFTALCAARAKIVGVAGIVLCIAFSANPAEFAPGHMSDMREISSAVAPHMHPGDVVAVAQPEQTPLAWYYLPAGLRWANALGPVSDPRVMNWDNALGRLQHTSPTTTAGSLVASLRPGQQLLFIRPLTEGAKNWKTPWASLVDLRAAQWGRVLTEDVTKGILTPVGTAPNNYPGDCCVASSAVLYRKGS